MILTYVTRHILRTTLSARSSRATKEKMEATRERLAQLWNEVFTQCLLNALIYIIFACTPQLWTKFTYLFPVTFIAYMIMFLKASSV
jgi:hypothetical protein